MTVQSVASCAMLVVSSIVCAILCRSCSRGPRNTRSMGLLIMSHFSLVMASNPLNHWPHNHEPCTSVCVCVCVCEDKQEKESANLRTRLICAGRDAAACPSWTTTCHPHTTVTSHSVCISMSKMIVRVCVVSLRGCAGRTLQKSRLRRGRPPSRTARATPRGRRPPPRRWTGCTRPWRAPLPPP